MTLKLQLFADYFQFYLQDDDGSLGSLADAWTQNATQRTRIVIAPGVVGVGTARNDTVAVELEVAEAEPVLDVGPWAHVVEADLLCATGRIVVAGCTDYFPDARRVEVQPGRLRVRVLYGKATPNAQPGGDSVRYRVELWPTVSAQPVTVLKQGPSPWAG